MVVDKFQYHTPHLEAFGTARDALLSVSNPQVRQAVQELAEDSRKIMRSRNSGQA
ncbi:hypothetical protein [Erythrobacter sp.]|uniref:hypothetical protein n=1 Tax=Erythrobacter sp. TaxID=1042 RepID=UPI0025D86152|nr:hypothetical protein [Erythrobacter sp.]